MCNELVHLPKTGSMVAVMSPKLTRTLLLISNLAIPLAVFVFATGFFPYKPFLPGRAQYDVEGGDPVPATFDTVIFMVVDALRRLNPQIHRVLQYS